jgi:hypothetical protein
MVLVLAVAVAQQLQVHLGVMVAMEFLVAVVVFVRLQVHKQIQVAMVVQV